MLLWCQSCKKLQKLYMRWSEHEKVDYLFFFWGERGLQTGVQRLTIRWQYDGSGGCFEGHSNGFSLGCCSCMISKAFLITWSSPKCTGWVLLPAFRTTLGDGVLADPYGTARGTIYRKATRSLCAKHLSSDRDTPRFWLTPRTRGLPLVSFSKQQSVNYVNLVVDGCTTPPAPFTIEDSCLVQDP